MKVTKLLASIRWPAMLVSMALVLSACAATPSHASAPTTAPTQAYAVSSQPTAAPAESTGSTVQVAQDPKLGNILVDSSGMTLYAYTKDGPDQVNCTGACQTKWPPLITQGSPTAGSGVDAAMLGTATQSDGTQVVTYNHMPLYTWYKDQAPGDTSGQGVLSVWYTVSPDGTLVKK